jgi:hypothetical protein
MRLKEARVRIVLAIAFSCALGRASAATIVVRLKEAVGGAPVSGVRVRLETPVLWTDPHWPELAGQVKEYRRLAEQETDAQGTYRFADVPVGCFVVNVVANSDRYRGQLFDPAKPPWLEPGEPLRDYFSSLAAFTAGGGPRVNVAIRSVDESREVIVRFWRRETVRFEIVDAAGAPIANTKVIASFNETFVRDLIERATVADEVALRSPDSWERATADADLMLVYSALVIFRRSSTTNAKGEVELEVPKGEPTWLWVDRSALLPGWQPREEFTRSLSLILSAPRATLVARVVVPTIDLAQPRLKGKIVGSDGPSRGILALAGSAFATAPLGEDGSFAFHGLPPGTYALVVGDRVVREIVLDEKPKSIELTLEPSKR